MQRYQLLVLVTCLGAAACGGQHRGPGLPACTRPADATGCTATWSGATSGSTACTQTTWSGTGFWAFTLDGAQLTVQLSLPSAPTAGQSYSMAQIQNPLIQLTPGGGLWLAINTEGGDLLFRADQVVPGSLYAHGSLAGSLVKDGGGDGVQICITF